MENEEDVEDHKFITVLLAQQQGVCAGSSGIAMPIAYWHALVSVALTFGWSPDGVPWLPPRGRTAEQWHQDQIEFWLPGVCGYLQKPEAARLAGAVACAMPDVGSHEQFLELQRNSDDFFTTVASPLQWLGFEREALLVAKVLPCLRSGACHIRYVDWLKGQ